jgi:hypothetical protein
MRRGTTDASPAFPEITQQLGYNPARFLVPTDDTIASCPLWLKRPVADM